MKFVFLHLELSCKAQKAHGIDKFSPWEVFFKNLNGFVWLHFCVCLGLLFFGCFYGFFSLWQYHGLLLGILLKEECHPSAILCWP